MDSDADDPAERARWECFGVAINAIRHPTWILAFFNALERGYIAARAGSDPPHTGNDVLDAAGAPSPEWWLRYSEFCDNHTPTPAVWVEWLYDQVEVELSVTVRLLGASLEEQRKSVADRRRDRGRQASTWSDIEVLAWSASQDRELVARMRAFGHQDSKSAMEARAAGLRYLQFQVATHYCRCGTNRPLLPIDAPEGCTCLKPAWASMLARLKQGAPAAVLLSEDGPSRHVLPAEFRTAELDTRAGTFRLLKEPGELLFEQADVETQRILEARFSNSEINKWIDAHPQCTNVKEALKAFMKDPRAKGLSRAFETVWQDKFKRARGRPTKPV